MVAKQRDLNSLYVITAVFVLVVVTATFGSLIAVFFWRSQNSYLWQQNIPIPSLLWVTTAILLASSATLELGRYRLKGNDKSAFYRFVQWTTALGFIFLIGQCAAWMQVMSSHVVLAKDKHSWFIFLFCSLHGLHIVVGVAGLAYLLYRARQQASGPRYQMTTRAYTSGLSIFWHYLGFLWIVLFVLLLTWRR